MESKRIKFALFTCVFALYGCVSASGGNFNVLHNAANDKTNVSIINTDTTSYKPALLTVADRNSIEGLAFQATVVDIDESNIFQKIRSKKGTLITKGEFERISKNLMELGNQKKIKLETIAKEEEERKRLEEEAKKILGAFFPTITTYGVDCYGCNSVNGRGGTAMGVGLDINQGVQMPDGSWQPGIKYGNYYIIAADASIPMCSVVKISDHGLSGSGITPDQPYYAIVLDRGGAIRGGHLDLYIGSEQSRAIQQVLKTTPRAEIIRLGGQNGKSCAL